MQKHDFFLNQEFVEWSREKKECGQLLVDVAKALARTYGSSEEHHRLSQPWWVEFRSPLSDYEDTIC
jgi:hypothetical protein